MTNDDVAPSLLSAYGVRLTALASRKNISEKENHPMRQPGDDVKTLPRRRLHVETCTERQNFNVLPPMIAMTTKKS
jgi:hypothetical protein